MKSATEQLQQINDLGLWDFRSSRSEDGALLILASNDFTYSHYAEIEFSGVQYSDLPEEFSHAEFRLADGADDITVFIAAEPFPDDNTMHEYELHVSGIDVRIGTVYYYDRPNLKPGERVAAWVKRST